MMKYFLFLFFTITAWANQIVPIRYLKDGSEITLYYNTENQTYIFPKECSQNRNCNAYKILKSSTLRQVDMPQTLNGRNPGEFICKHLSETKVYPLFRPAGHQLIVCEFEDGSLLNVGALYKYYLKR